VSDPAARQSNTSAKRKVPKFKSVFFSETGNQKDNNVFQGQTRATQKKRKHESTLSSFKIFFASGRERESSSIASVIVATGLGHIIIIVINLFSSVSLRIFVSTREE
jgi:hypothetical protein